MKTVGKLFRTTAFKLSLAYFVLFSLGAWVVLASVGQRVEGSAGRRDRPNNRRRNRAADRTLWRGRPAPIGRFDRAPRARARRFDLSRHDLRRRIYRRQHHRIANDRAPRRARSTRPSIGGAAKPPTFTITRWRKLVVLPGELPAAGGPRHRGSSRAAADSAAGTWRLAVLAGLGRHAWRPLRRPSDAGARRRHVGLGATHHGRRSRSTTRNDGSRRRTRPPRRESQRDAGAHRRVDDRLARGVGQYRA